MAHWPQLLALELLDAVALDQAVCLEDHPTAADLLLVEVERSISRPLLLACRRDPLVMEITASLSKWMEAH
jgi:hypothetical protein